MNETKLEIYPNRHKSLEVELGRLYKAKISPRNKELITELQNFMFSKGTGQLRIAKVSSQLRNLCEWIAKLGIEKNLDKLDKKDSLAIVSHINRLQGKKPSTKADYRRALKQFYRWFKEEDPRVYSRIDEERIEAKKLYNFLEKEVSISYRQDTADPNTILTETDIEQVLEKGCRTPKEKAFISLLHETGCRAAEFLNLRVGSIQIKDNYAEVHVPDGKTGRRTIYVVKSLPALIRYLDVHPFKTNQNAFLWLSSSGFNMCIPILYRGAQKLVVRCFERAGFIEVERAKIILESGKKQVKTVKRRILKRCNLHWFRHSRATILAPKLTEVMLCKYMGWVIGSKQVKTYVHLCNKQLQDVFLQLHQIQKPQDEGVGPIKCICGALNTPTERYCFKCCKPLKVETVIQDKELVDTEINKTMQFFMDVAKKPELMKKFEEFKESQEKEDSNTYDAI